MSNQAPPSPAAVGGATRPALICLWLFVLVSSELADPALIIDPITEERASRTLYRIELLRRIREQVLPNPLLAERLKLCQPSPDLPEWWECGRHDHDLLLGASKHGVSRTDYHILNDPALAFLEAQQRFGGQRGSGLPPGGPGETHRAAPGGAEGPGAALLTPAELAGAANVAAGAAKDAEVKTEEVVKMESEERPNIETEALGGEKEEQGEAEEGKSERAASPQLPKAEEEEEEEGGESPSGTESKEQKQEPDEEPGEGEVAGLPADAGGQQREVSAGPPEPAPPTERPHPQERDPPESPKSADTGKTPEEEDEERLDEDDKSEKSSQAEGKRARVAGGGAASLGGPGPSVSLLCVHLASAEQKNFDEESIASVSTSAHNETRDGFCPDDLAETSALQVLAERAYGFSSWPKVSEHPGAERRPPPPSANHASPSGPRHDQQDGQRLRGCHEGQVAPQPTLRL